MAFSFLKKAQSNEEKTAYDWVFADNQGISYDGLNDSGIETFAGNRYESLAREICQNSLDARLDQNKPVVVEFKQFEMETRKLPGYQSIHEIFGLCRMFWASNQKASSFFEQGLKLLKAQRITNLRISDFNSTGVEGSDVRIIRNANDMTPWYHLVKSDGVSGKEGSSGGSFGIGKTAPFASSSLRTIFYSTLDKNGIEGYQGVSRLTTFTRGENTHQGTGYFANKADLTTIPIQLQLDDQFVRHEPGTDIYVVGFIQDDNWETRILKTVLEDFMLAIYWGHLEVIINGHSISKANLGEVISTFFEKTNEKLIYAQNYYDVISSQEAIEETCAFHEMGNIRLRILFNGNYHRKVLITRKSGMKLFDKDRISKNIGFAAIALLEGDELNSYFRNLENPQHNSWDTDRVQDKKAKKYKTELFKWIKDTINGLGSCPDEEEIDVEGLNELLPDEYFAISNQKNQDKIEVISERIDNIDVTMDKADQNKNDEREIYEQNQVNDITGDEDEGHNDAFTRAPKGKTNDSAGGLGTRTPTSNGGDGAETLHKENSIGLMSVRTMLTDKATNCYRIILTPRKNAYQTVLKLFASGETAKLPLKIIKAVNHLDGQELRCLDRGIRLGDVVKNEKVSVDFQIDAKENYSMEVSLYGYKEK